MLPIKMDLTEKVAATLRELRLEYPVNGEILTAEKLSKAIGNNRAWMSQIESRRLKKIKREDIIKIYKLLHNENDDKKAEQIAEADLCSPFETRYDSEKRGDHFVNDSFSEGIVSLDNLISELRDVFLDEYKKRTNSLDRNALLGTIESMISNFQNDFEHTNTIYTIPISYADPEYFGDKYSQKYYEYVSEVCKQYAINMHEAFEKANLGAFSESYDEDYHSIIDDLLDIDSAKLYDNIDLIMEIDYYTRRVFIYIVEADHFGLPSLNINMLFDKINSMIETLYIKLKIQVPIPVKVPNDLTDSSTLDSIQLEFSHRIMKAIKLITIQSK